MSVQLEQFRVVGVNRASGEDVSVVIEAATKAAAEVKAEQQGIETTHIARLKQADELPPDEQLLFSADAAEALSTHRTGNLIHDIASAVPDEPAPARPEPPRPEPVKPTKASPLPEVVAAISRPAYSSPATRREPENSSPLTAFAFVLLVLAGLVGGAYYVLIHEPNALIADEHELLFGDDIYIDAAANAPGRQAQGPQVDAFNNRPKNQPAATQPVGNAVVPPNTVPRQPAADLPALVLQSVVTSHEGRFAVINGKLYKEGSELAGCKLLNVADDWVLMERLGEQFVLEIESNDSPNQR